LWNTWDMISGDKWLNDPWKVDAAIIQVKV
jgi:hypothetical protein